MTVPVQTPANRSTASGSTPDFAYDFLLLAKADMLVTIDGVVKVLDTDYTIPNSGINNQTGGLLTFAVNPTAGAYVELVRNMPYKRDTDYQEGGDLLSDTLDRDIDRCVMLIQQLKEAIARNLSVPDGVLLSNYNLPVPQAGYHLRWNSTEDALENAINIDITGVIVSAFMEDFLSASDDVAARAKLFIGTMGTVDFGSIGVDFTFQSGKRPTYIITSSVAMANGIDLPTSVYNQTLLSLVNNDYIDGNDGDTGAGLYRTGKIFSWWHKVGTVSRKCVDWVLSATAGASEFIFDGNIKRTINTGASAVSYDVGLLDIPQVIKNSDYTYALVDRGMSVERSSADATARAYTIPPNATVAFPVGAVIAGYNGGSANNITLTRGAGVTLRLAGGVTDANRTCVPGAQWVLRQVATDVWTVSGPGVI